MYVGKPFKTNKLVLYIAIASYLALFIQLTIHLSLYISYCSKALLFSDFCVMNMIHTCDSNKFTQRKRSSYYIIGTVLSYITLFLMFPGINVFLLLCIDTYSWFKYKASQNRGSSKPLEPPWLRA